MMEHTPGPWKYNEGEYGCKTIKGRKAGTHKQAQYQTEVAYTPARKAPPGSTADAIEEE